MPEIFVGTLIGVVTATLVFTIAMVVNHVVVTRKAQGR